MAYFRNESNVFCDSVNVALDAGASSGKLHPRKNLSAPVAPFKVASVLVKFVDKASGSFDVTVTKGGLDFTLVSQTVSSADSAVVNGIDIWMLNGDGVTVTNNTDQGCVAIVDFSF